MAFVRSPWQILVLTFFALTLGTDNARISRTRIRHGVGRRKPSKSRLSLPRGVSVHAEMHQGADADYPTAVVLVPSYGGRYVEDDYEPLHVISEPLPAISEPLPVISEGSDDESAPLELGSGSVGLGMNFTNVGLPNIAFDNISDLPPPAPQQRLVRTTTGHGNVENVDGMVPVMGIEECAHTMEQMRQQLAHQGYAVILEDSDLAEAFPRPPILDVEGLDKARFDMFEAVLFGSVPDRARPHETLLQFGIHFGARPQDTPLQFGINFGTSRLHVDALRQQEIDNEVIGLLDAWQPVRLHRDGWYTKRLVLMTLENTREISGGLDQYVSTGEETGKGGVSIKKTRALKWIFKEGAMRATPANTHMVIFFPDRLFHTGIVVRDPPGYTPHERLGRAEVTSQANVYELYRLSP